MLTNYKVGFSDDRTDFESAHSKYLQANEAARKLSRHNKGREVVMVSTLPDGQVDRGYFLNGEAICK